MTRTVAHFVLLLSVTCTLMTGCARIQNRNAKIPAAVNNQQVDMRFGIARLMERNGKVDEARTAYLEILKQIPDHYESLHRVAVSLVRQERIAESLVFFEKASKIKTPDALLLGDWGFAQHLAGDNESAEISLRKAIQLSSNDQRAINNLAIVLGEEDRLNEAFELFSRVNNEAEAIANLAFVQAQLGKYEEAKASYHRALEIKPSLEIAAKGLLELHEKTAGSEPSGLSSKVSDRKKLAAILGESKKKQKGKAPTAVQEPDSKTPDIRTSVRESSSAKNETATDKSLQAEVEFIRLVNRKEQSKTETQQSEDVSAKEIPAKKNAEPQLDSASSKSADSKASVFADEFKIFR